MQARIPKLVSFGLGGHVIYFEPEYEVREGVRRVSSTSSLSGYEKPESFERAIASGQYSYTFPDGIPVIDKRGVLEARPGLAVTMPMFGCKLEPNGVDRFTYRDSAVLRVMAESAESGSFGTLARAAIADESFSGLDEVGSAVYVALWAAEGARIGEMKNGKIQWITKEGSHVR